MDEVYSIEQTGKIESDMYRTIEQEISVQR